jgi:hypothetical protein
MPRYILVLYNPSSVNQACLVLSSRWINSVQHPPAPGAYSLTLALYDVPNGPGLPVQQTGQAPAPVLDLGTIQVTTRPGN